MTLKKTKNQNLTEQKMSLSKLCRKSYVDGDGKMRTN